MADWTKISPKQKKIWRKDQGALPPEDIFAGTPPEAFGASEAEVAQTKKALARKLANMNAGDARKMGFTAKEIQAARAWYGSTKVKTNVEARQVAKGKTPSSQRSGTTKVPAGGSLINAVGQTAPKGYYYDQQGYLRALGRSAPSVTTKSAAKVHPTTKRKRGGTGTKGEIIKGEVGKDFEYNAMKYETERNLAANAAANTARIKAERERSTREAEAPIRAVAGLVQDVANWLSGPPSPEQKAWSKGQMDSAAPSPNVVKAGKKLTQKAKQKKAASVDRSKMTGGYGR